MLVSTLLCTNMKRNLIFLDLKEVETLSYLGLVRKIVNGEIVVKMRRDEQVLFGQPLLNCNDLQLPLLSFSNGTYRRG